MITCLLFGLVWLGVRPSQAGAANSVGIIEINSEEAFATYVRSGLPRPGDVVIFDIEKLDRNYVLEQARLPGHSDASPDEPTYLVSRKYFEAVLEAHNLNVLDFQTLREIRNLILRMPHGGKSAVETVYGFGIWNAGAVVDRDLLASLAFPRLQFNAGSWVMADFDVHAHTDQRVLIQVQSSANLVLAYNRFSNCADDFSECAWSERDEKGAPCNGGRLLSIHSQSPGSEIRNNVFENLRGFLLIALSNGSKQVRTSSNTFRHIERWGNNAAEAIMLGSIPFVLNPIQDPVLAPVSALVSMNWFYDYWGEDELISIKSTNNLIVGNVINDSGGGISMRDGAGTRVYGNLIVRARSIRIMGDRQFVRRNLIVLPRGLGIWFENGASRAGYLCRGNRVTQLIEPLRWIYRPARSPVVESNRIEVAHDRVSPAIGKRDLKKTCGYRSCGEIPSAPIPCNRNLTDAFIDDLLASKAGNSIVVLDQEATERRRKLGLMPGDAGW